MGSDLDFNLGRIHAGHDGHQIGNRRRNLIESARLGDAAGFGRG